MLDFVFTQRELFWLDDLLPGSKPDKPKSATDSSDRGNGHEKVDDSNNLSKQKLLSGNGDHSSDKKSSKKDKKSKKNDSAAKNHV